jgi:hypothetical protein
VQRIADAELARLLVNKGIEDPVSVKIDSLFDVSGNGTELGNTNRFSDSILATLRPVSGESIL